MPPSLGFWPLEIHIIQHMSSADGKNIATFFIRSFAAPLPPPKAMLKARTPLRDGDSSRLSTLPLGGGGGGGGDLLTDLILKFVVRRVFLKFAVQDIQDL